MELATIISQFTKEKSSVRSRKGKKNTSKNTKSSLVQMEAFKVTLIS